ncbi:AHH domain-containing protein [Lentibacillus jeotgali]|uniref:AHH domain-containing protein n=1 Tax=Lentibacillus jeotgali TaxID=558169 RepID=UPI001FDEAB4C|nr:AHH domain-containing protein [Lentibacillus jeotgali]
MLAEKFEMRTAEYSFRALNVVTASVGSDISEQEFATVRGQVVNTEKVSDYKNDWYGNYHTLMDGRIIWEFMDNEGNVNYKFVSEIPESRLKPEEEEEKNAFQKSIGAFKEIGLDVWSGLEERGQKATDSWYDFGNYLTLGAFDLAKNTHSGLQYNAENMLNSPADFANWLTMGGVDMVNGAVNPDEAFSKEHWKSSFGLFLTGVGARGVSAPKSSGMPKTNSKVTSNDQESTVSAAQATSATRKLPTLTNIREWYRVNVPEMGLVQDSMGGYYFAVKKGDGENTAVNSDGPVNVTNSGGADRLIPGRPGVVTGGNSNSLGKNMLEDMRVKRSAKWSGYQAQHIIPSEMANNPVIKKIGMNLDDTTNGIFLRIPNSDISPMSRHRGYHSVYNEVVAKKLNSMDINQSVDVLQKQVYDLQSNLRKLQENGLPLYPRHGATVELWERKLKQLE